MTDNDLNAIFKLVEMGDVEDVFERLRVENHVLARRLLDIASAYLSYDDGEDRSQIERLWITNGIREVHSQLN